MGSLMNRRRMLINDGYNLPHTYQRCSYLQTVGNSSYINTGVPGNDNTIKMDFYVEVLSIGQWAQLIGNHESEQTKCWRFIQGTTSTSTNTFNMTLNHRRAGSSPTVKITSITDRTNKVFQVHMEYTSGYMVYNGQRFDSSATDADENETSTNNIFIGRAGPKASSSATNPSNRFYNSFQIRKQGVLVRYYIPCYRKYDNVAGFYDLVNNTFNPSIGTNQFSAGNVV